jgi:hypothetical protein
MKTIRIVLAALAMAGFAACEGGGVDLNVSNTDNSVDNSSSGGGGGDDDEVCASYTPANSNQAVGGSFDGTNCIYGTDFVSESNPLLVDVTIPFITGAHIFQGSLFVGENVSSGAAPAEGEGPTLTIAAGNTLVFQDAADYVLINRGSQIIASGLPGSPITFTSFTDEISDSAGANDVQQWGGIVINGSGITNNCSDAQRAADDCHVLSEGQPSHYGGDNNSESSGILQYVIVKHTGFEVAPDNELNGITFNAVGSGTVVENIQVYSTYDDGIEFFGGAVNVTNFVALYVRDDSIDYSDGYVGTVENALVIQWRNDGNRCVEGDNVGEVRADAGVPLDTAPLTEPTVRNMTCIVSNQDLATGGTHDDSEGPTLRRGSKIILENSIVYSGYGTTVNAVTSNECFEIDDNDGVSRGFAAANDNFNVQNTVFACEEGPKDNLNNGDTILEWVLGTNPSTNGADYSFNVGNVVITDVTNANVQVLQSGTYYTAAAIVDAAGTTVIADASGLGGVQSNDDWTAPWAFGLRATNRDEALWFAP